MATATLRAVPKAPTIGPPSQLPTPTSEQISRRIKELPRVQSDQIKLTTPKNVAIAGRGPAWIDMIQFSEKNEERS